MYNAKLAKTPKLYKEYSEAEIGNNRIFGVLISIKQILKNDIHWNDFVENIELLFKRYKKVEFKTMGFPENWRELLEVKN